MFNQIRLGIRFTVIATVVSLSLIARANANFQALQMEHSQIGLGNGLLVVSVPSGGTFNGRGIASGSVFTQGRQADARLNFNSSNNFSLSLVALTVRGMEANYNGTITRRLSGRSSNSFTLEGRVRTYASSGNNLRVINTSGSCRIEVFNSRIALSVCNMSSRNHSSRFQ
jgi:hypothetical protein